MSVAEHAVNGADKTKLPEGWRWARFGEVCEIIAGQSPPSETYRKNAEGLPFF
jgi:type I restriction enzyme S subunit